MRPTLCSRCKKNVAVVFITKIEGSETKNEGLCLKCARELGIKPYVMPYRDFDNKTRPSQYAKDLAQYVNKPMLFKSCSFKDFSPRKGFRCEAYFHTNNTITN